MRNGVARSQNGVPLCLASFVPSLFLPSTPSLSSCCNPSTNSSAPAALTILSHREAKRAEAEATKQLEATKEVEKGSEEAGVDSDFVILGSKDLIEAEANMERNASSAATTATAAADSDGPKVVEMDAGEDEEDNEGGYFFSSREKKGSRWNKSFSSSSGEAGSSSVQPKASEPEEPDYGDLPPSMRPM